MDGYEIYTDFDGEDLHALAALALHDQPFGFTHNDVTMLMVGALVARYETAGLASDTLVSRLESIAARIEALLPPEDPET